MGIYIFLGKGTDSTPDYSIYKALEGTDTLVTNDTGIPDSPVFFSESSGYAIDMAVAEDGTIYFLLQAPSEIVKPVIGMDGEEVVVADF